MFQLILKAYQEVAVMYALAQKQTCAAHNPMSAKCQYRTFHHSFDHLVGSGEQPWRDGDAKRLGGPEIDDQLKFGRLLDG